MLVLTFGGVASVSRIGMLLGRAIKDLLVGSDEVTLFESRMVPGAAGSLLISACSGQQGRSWHTRGGALGTPGPKVAGTGPLRVCGVKGLPL